MMAVSESLKDHPFDTQSEKCDRVADFGEHSIGFRTESGTSGEAQEEASKSPVVGSI
jgi:hypothetical protein